MQEEQRPSSLNSQPGLNKPGSPKRRRKAAWMAVLGLIFLGGPAYVILPHVGLPMGKGVEADAKADSSPARLPVGETLKYALMWKGMHAGDITFRIVETVPMGTRAAYHLRMDADSTGLLDSAYAVHDRVESFVDTEAGCSLRFERHIREGTWKIYKADDRVDFDYDRSELRYQATKTDDHGNKHIKTKPPRPLPGPVQDPLSVFYALRRKLPAAGESRTIQIAGRKSVDPIAIEVKKSEDVAIPGVGMFKAALLGFAPPKDAEVGNKIGLFLEEGNKERELSFWVDQKTGIPLRLEISGIPFVGSVMAVLRRAENSPLRPAAASAGAKAGTE